MAQRASFRDHTSLAIEKRRSNRTVYILRRGAQASYPILRKVEHCSRGLASERFNKPPTISRTDQLVLLFMRDKLPDASFCFVLHGDCHRFPVGREREAGDLDHFPVVFLNLLDRILADAF